VREPVVSTDTDDVCYLNASASGLFVPEVKHGARLNKGDLVGKIVDPLCGEVLDEVRAPHEGMLFTIRDYPIVDEGSLMGRILREKV
jgi:predicted deacylase